ncbi:MAG TPA: hypothetical protein VHO06_22015 [Polyangia bacterium]|nr:hypothetical protein [Polyangia bacterium]
MSRTDLEDAIAALCMIASIAHLFGDEPGRDGAVEAAAELARELAVHASC